jgi:hypothetical protein
MTMQNNTRSCVVCGEDDLPLDRFYPSSIKSGERKCKLCKSEARRHMREAYQARLRHEAQAMEWMGLKNCRRCCKTVPRIHFDADKRRSDGLYPYCKECRREYSGAKRRQPAKYATRAEYMKARSLMLDEKLGRRRYRVRYLKETYGMSIEQYESMLADQRGACAICGCAETTARTATGETVNLAVDHDHQCCPGKKSCGHCVRGLLCMRCNTAIGALGEDLDRIAAVLAYLRKAQQLRLVG